MSPEAKSYFHLPAGKLHYQPASTPPDCCFVRSGSTNKDIPCSKRTEQFLDYLTWYSWISWYILDIMCIVWVWSRIMQLDTKCMFYARSSPDRMLGIHTAPEHGKTLHIAYRRIAWLHVFQVVRVICKELFCWHCCPFSAATHSHCNFGLEGVYGLKNLASWQMGP